jgi:beclin 1-associated autophagy-related key regulator
MILSPTGSNSEMCHDNNDLTLTVPVAVSFVAHAVYIIANVLDQKLPYSLILPVVLCEYGRADRKSQAIVRFLAKLDDNLMFLCFTQNVPLNMIQVGHTIRNLSTLVTHDELGRSGPFTCHPELLRYQLVSKKRHLLMDEDEDHPPLLHSAHEEEEDKLQNPDDSSEDESDSEQIENATTVGEDWEEVHEMMIPPHFHPGLYGERLEYGTLYSDYSHQTIQSESKQQDMYSNESVQSSIGLFDTLSSLLGSGWSKK